MWISPKFESYALHFPFGEESVFSYQIRVFQQGEHVLSVFQATEAHCKHLVHTEHLAGEQLNGPSYNRGLGGKKSGVAFHCKPPLGLVFIHRVAYILQAGSFQPLVLCHL